MCVCVCLLVMPLAVLKEMGIPSARNFLRVSLSKPFKFYECVRSLSNQQQQHGLLAKSSFPSNEHLSSATNPTSAQTRTLNFSTKLDSVDSLAYWRQSGKPFESFLPTFIKLRVTVQQSPRLDASRYNTKRLKSMFNITCRHSTFPPRPVLKILDNNDNSNNASFPDVLAHIYSNRSISTDVDKESHSATKLKTGPPKSLDDFQHEEIVGPTVDKDLSATANELRECLEKLTNSMLHLTSAFKALAVLQIVGALWAGIVVSPNHHTLLLINMSGAVLAISLAYFLRQAQKSMLFFSKLEDRSRLRIITLSLQVIKAFFEFISRTNVVVRVVSVGVLLTLLVDIWLLYGKHLV
ncbi:hypothetical protein O6H91_14G019300 [Diphasiastrum complanatum]|uniref:Uncharacterized protein n=1 Tax=Diphasiastrum complanatum TaxID=34168 RepID=A0ACC2BM00_DIPCM|nr:hypothetical protein O6H91_14G019300 [Diphasiastrum complanatum]